MGSLLLAAAAAADGSLLLCSCTEGAGRAECDWLASI